MRRSILSILLLMLLLNASAQYYLFDSIPDKLRKGANAVVRTHQCLFTITKPGNAIWHEKQVITLLNENAEGLKSVLVDYDKSRKVNYLKGIVYDEKGEIIKSLGALDVQDYSAFFSEAFYTDDRMKVLTFPDHKYPYTIEYEYEVEYSSMVGYPDWEFRQSPDMSVEKSGIQVVVPTGMSVRSWTERLKNPVDSVIEKDNRIYTWQEENLPADSKFKYEYKAVSLPPTLHLGPIDFNYGGFHGSMSSWKSYGEWCFNLIKGRDILPEDQKKKVLQIIAGASDDREKVKLIYEYMQANTRYVLLDIGIGGFQPALAEDVSKNGYGDCKALVNYTKGLLKAAGIESYFTLVRAGEESPINRNFVDQAFNHVILCVPMKKDTVWLECTNQYCPFNYLGTFTDNRDVLLITPDGGKLVRTPSFSRNENFIRRTGIVSLNNFGKSTLRLNTRYSGSEYSKKLGLFETYSEDELKRYLAKYSRFSDISTTSVKYNDNKSEKPSSELAYEMVINDFGSLTGTILSFNPTLGVLAFIPDITANIEIKRGITIQDSIIYNLPLGYKVDIKPSDVDESCRFGKYSYKFVAKNDRLIYQRCLELNVGEIPAEQSGDFRKFINTIAAKDREIVILTKN